MMAQCLELFKGEFKEFRQFITPLIEIVMNEIKPYLFYFCFFSICNTILLLCILYILIKKYFIK